jgi:serine/threonine-protein kinase
VESSSTSLVPLSVLDGRYQLLRLLGEGGMGVVYEARHSGTGRRCAVKVIGTEALAKSPDSVARFQREAMASGAIESQHIAQVLDTGVDAASGSPYIVMELLVGEDLDATLARTGPLPPDVALRIVGQACIGLEKAHAAGIVHRDIKPANLFLSRQDGALVTKILDFGIAKVMKDPLGGTEAHSLTRSGSLLGSPLYMSPEQALGQKTIDHRTDVWSLGVVLYEALSGVTPHATDETLGVLIMKICGQPPPPVQLRAPWVSPEVAEVVHRALATDPSARWASAADMLAAIRAVVPQGLALDESMLVSLSPEAKERAAPRFDVPTELQAVPALLAEAPITTPRALLAGPVPAGSLAGEVVSGRREKRSRGPLVAVASVGALLAVAAAVRLSSKTEAAVVPVTVAAASAAQPSPPAPRTSRLVIVPSTAFAEVDGSGVAVTNGTVPIVGEEGTSHRVRVSLGDREANAVVAITRDGTDPPLVELPPPGPAVVVPPMPAAPIRPAREPQSSPAPPPKNPLRMEMK